MRALDDIRREILELADHFHHQGEFDQAEQLYQGLLAENPSSPDALHRLGVLRCRQGRFSEALQLIEAALNARPYDPVAHSNCGLAHTALGQPEAALAHYDMALALKADFADARNGRGNALMQLGRKDDALASYEQAVALKPDFEQALNGGGNALLELGRPSEALARYDAALAFKPDFAEALNNRGAALKTLQRSEEALAAYEAALAVRPNYPEALNNRAVALADLRRPAEALESYDAAIALRPDDPELHDNRGVLLTELGRFEEAAMAAERAIALSPKRVRSYYNLTMSNRSSPDVAHLRAMEELARDTSSLSVEERIDLHFALGKVMADRGAHAASFHHLLSGNRLKRSQTDYDEAAVSGLFQRMSKALGARVMRERAGQGEPCASPVFIIGMPRSGTTLVEQILASHSQVYAAGETDDFARAMLGVDGLGGDPAASPEAMSSMSDEQLRAVGARYVELITEGAPAATRIVDKTMENFRFAGLIHLALPNAKIIHVRRDPRDTCVSCFSKLFHGYLPYTYDLAELGRYYRRYDDLMAHWRRVTPATAMLEVRYEDVVADLETQTRRILAHCGLDWDVNCLDFHLTQRAVRTASATQVRQPIYDHSIGRWRSYAPFLEPLLTELEAA